MSMDTQPPEVLDPQLVENLRALQDPDDPDLALEVISLFLTDSGARIMRMRDAAARGDNSAIAELAHQMKGSAGVLSAGRLLETSAELEQVARHRSPDAATLADLLGRVSASLEEVRGALARLGFTGPDGRGTPPR